MASTRSGARIEILLDRVVKTHAPGTDPVLLGRRLRLVAGHPAFVPPLNLDIFRSDSGCLVTSWPQVEVASASDRTLPWTPAARLLAGLHRSPTPDGLPSHGWASRLDRARDRAPAGLTALGSALAAELADRREPAVVGHGDWHLGQLGAWTDGWRLIDIDDVGLGDPAWDLARPAGFWAAGLLDDASWHDFLDAYRGADGPAVPPHGDPWPALDLPARVAVFVAAVHARISEEEHSRGTASALVEACRRMAP